MAEINFNFKGAFTKMQCNTDDKIKDICKRFALKSEQDINDIYFLYDGGMVDLSDEKLTVCELTKSLDKSSKMITILVNKSTSTIIEENHNLKSKDIICPNCSENVRIKIEDYKITLFECENKHSISDIFFKDFENTQYIDESKIKCDICKNNNKADTFRKKFYKCNSCKLNLCPLCKKSHNNEHYIIDYDLKNYYCDMHNELYNSYCITCKKNICIECEKAHKMHDILSYCDLFPEQNEKQKELDEFKNLIDKVKIEIKEIINICDNFIGNIEIYYKIYNDIINNYDYNNKNRNYQILKNINDIKDKNIINDMNEIVKEKNKSLKFDKIYEIYNKMNKKKVIKEAEVTKNLNKNNNKIINNNNINYNKNNYKTHNGFYSENLHISKEIKNNLNKNNNKNNTKANNNKDIKRKIEKYTNKNINGLKLKSTRNSKSKKGNKNKILYRNNKNNERRMKTPFKQAKSFPIFKPIKDANEISIIYKIDENDKNKGEVKIFGHEFVMNNAKECNIIHNNKEYDLTENFNIKDIKENTFEIKLINIKNIKNMSYMFIECSSLLTIKGISNWNTSNITDMSYLFYGCSSLSKISGISEWDTKNVINMSYLFSSCKHLEKLPDISKWNVINVKDMNNIFSRCNSLKELPDISKWNTSNVKDMRGIFNNCNSLEKLPDISKWNTNNVIVMNNLFNGCKSLSSLPDISKWVTSNVTSMNKLFNECSSLKAIPDISKWNTNNVITMNNIFSGCNSLSSLPKISTFNVKNKENIFSGCPERLIPKK